MRKFGLVGFPLGHSYSKKFFTEKFLSEEINDAVYENYPLQDLSILPSLIKNDPDLCGLNVTIPYKSEVLKYVDLLSEEVKAIGAANVLKIKISAGNKLVKAFNTDVAGITETLNPHIKISGCKAMVLGTGGASKALKFALENLGCLVTLVSREAKAGVLSYEQITPELLFSNKIIINSTPLGMYPEVNTKPPIDYSRITKEHILFDLVYNPEITAFLNEGIKRGATVLTGIKMLRTQAEKAWYIWNSDEF